DSASLKILSKVFERWLISITDIPTPGRLSMSRCAASKTGTGNTAGPALKLKIRSVIDFSRYLVNPVNLEILSKPFTRFQDSQDLQDYSSNLDRNAFAATFVTVERGTKRSASTTNQLVQPETTMVFFRSSPRSAASTTCSAV